MYLLGGLSPLLDYRYWMNPRPVPLGPSLVGGTFAFFGWFVLAAVILWLIAKVVAARDPLKSGIFSRFARLLATTGILGYLFLFFTYEQIPLLGMRFWYLLLTAFFLAWLARVAMYLVRDYPREASSRKERERLERYLPKKKR